VREWGLNVKPRPHLRTLCADSSRTLLADTIRGLSVYRSHTVFCVHTYLACPANQAMSWSKVAAGICAEYIFVMRIKKRPKYAKRFWTRRVFIDEFTTDTTFFVSYIQSVVQDSRISLGWREVTLRFCSRNWRQNPKERYKISRSNSCLNQISRTALIFSQWRFFLNFKSDDSLYFGNKINRLTFLLQFLKSTQCASHKRALDCEFSIKVGNLSFDHMLTTQITQVNEWHIEGNKSVRGLYADTSRRAGFVCCFPS
jgi:hypothetical protein